MIDMSADDIYTLFFFKYIFCGGDDRLIDWLHLGSCFFVGRWGS